MITIISFILFLPHVLIFAMSRQKKSIILDLYSRKEESNKGWLLFLDLTSELFFSRYFRTLFYFRINNVFAKLLRVFYPAERTFIIDINSKIGSGVKLAHPYATIINAESIGDNLYVNHLVTVGEKNGKKPILGNNVQLHAGAIVIGDIIIGDNAVIGAGTVVIKDVPSNAIAVGNPAKIILR